MRLSNKEFALKDADFGFNRKGVKGILEGGFELSLLRINSLIVKQRSIWVYTKLIGKG
jgi:hypothetical protein